MLWRTNTLGQLVILHAAEATDAGRFGPKAANQAALGQAGLPIPGGYCLDAEAYRIQLRALGLESSARLVFATDGLEARRHALDIRLGLLDQPVDQTLLQPLLDTWRALTRGSGREAARISRFGRVLIPDH